MEKAGIRVAPIDTPCYCTREDVLDVLDTPLSARLAPRVDRAIDAASRSIEGLCHRGFYPTLGTLRFDWPRPDRDAPPWRLWLDRDELAASTDVVLTTGGVTIDSAAILFRPSSGPPYSYLELDTSTSAAFGGGSTPQGDISLTGWYGYSTATRPAGALAADTTSTATSITVTDGSTVGVGDTLVIGTERLLVTGRSMVDTGQTQQDTGAGTAKNNDQQLTVGDGTAFTAGEVILLDAERMLIEDVAGDVLAVKRAYQGTTLAEHSGAAVYAPRALTVVRGALGTTAATHTSGTTVAAGAVPGLVRQYAVGLAVTDMAGQLGAYAAVQGTGSAAQFSGTTTRVKAIGSAIDDLRDRVYATYGRKARVRAV